MYTKYIIKSALIRSLGLPSEMLITHNFIKGPGATYNIFECILALLQNPETLISSLPFEIYTQASEEEITKSKQNELYFQDLTHSVIA